MTGRENIYMNGAIMGMTKAEISRKLDEIVDFSGFGWGHGLGLSQWGAKQMAMNANPKDNNYFKTILKHYYQNVEINKLY